LKLPSGPFYQYAVQITPECDNSRLCNYLISQHEDFFKDNPYVYDGQAVLYTQQPLSKDKKAVDLVSTTTNTDQKYQIHIQFACTVSSADINQSVIQLFNIMYRRALRHLKLQQIGRNHYNMDDKYCVTVPQHHVKILPGLLSTIYTSSRGVLFNADVIYKTLRTDTVLDLIYDMKDKFYKNYEEKVRSTVKGTIVLCRYNNRTVHVDDIDWTKTPRDKFDKRGGGQISYQQYFKEQYNCDIKDLNQPLLMHKPKHKTNVEYYIPELCSLTGLTEVMRNDSNVMRDLKASTGLYPTERAKQILSFTRESAQNKDFAEVLKKWEFELDPRLIQLPGRVLPAEKVKFGNQNEVSVKMPSASWDIRTTPLFKAVNVQNWIVVCPPRSRNETNEFLDILFTVSRPLGINYDQPKIFEAKNTFDDYKDILKNNVSNDTKFAMVILPNDRKELYDAVKQILCLQKPVPSQCVVHRTIKNPKGLQSKATKIAVQLASKLGGAPWTLQFQFPGPTMMVGMDVYHSGEIVSRKKQSVVGFSASMNATLSSYYSRVVIQDPGKEIVEALQPCMESALNKFKEINNSYPKYVVFFRDGVGEGQVSTVMDKEVQSCFDAFKALNITDTKLSFLVVLKRIHTRLFLQSSDSDGLSNPAPGTIVDTDITGPGALEFFLVSQSVTQGTATPTRYQCIHNDCKFSADYLQTLTYKLCHMYYNWFGTIRVPAPCLYAHKIAFLVGQSTHKEDEQRRLNNRLFFL